MTYLPPVHWRMINSHPHVKFTYHPATIQRLKNRVPPQHRKWNPELKAWQIHVESIEAAVAAIGPRPMCPNCAARLPCKAWVIQKAKPPPPDPYPVGDWRNFNGFVYEDGVVHGAGG